MTRTFKGALLFDIDGTLTDTDPLHIRAFNTMLARFGRSITSEEYFRRVMGFTNAEIMRDFFPDMPVAEHRALADFKEATFRELAKTDLHPVPGLIDLLDWAESEGITMAAVTNAPTANAELMLTGRTLTADASLAAGLVSQVVDDADLPRIAQELANEIASNAPLATRAIKRMLRAGEAETFEAHVHHVFLQLIPLLRTKDFAEGVASFVERREPRFTGR